MIVRPKQRWFRFRMRTLLLLVTATCVVLGMGFGTGRQYERQKRGGESMIISPGGKIRPAGWARTASPGANWFSLWLGYGEPMETRWNVDLAGTKVTSAQLRQLGRCAWIRVLDLSNTTAGDEALGDIAGIAKLRELRLASTRVTDAGIAKLKALDRLYVLDVKDTAVTYKALADLEKAFPGSNFQEQLALSRLRKSQQIHTDEQYAGNSFELDVFPPPLIPKASEIHISNGNNFALSDRDVEDLRHLASASSFSVQGRAFPKGGLAFLSDLPNLENVAVYDSNVETVTNDDLATLAGLPRLKRLELYGHRLTDEGIAQLSAAHQIEYLSVHGPPLSPQFLSHLRGLRGLRQLDLNFWHRTQTRPPYDRPSVETIAAARENVKNLAAIPNLEELAVMGNLMVDDVVLEFAELTQLKKLKLDGRFSSLRAAERIQRALPNCRIERAYLK